MCPICNSFIITGFVWAHTLTAQTCGSQTHLLCSLMLIGIFIMQREEAAVPHHRDPQLQQMQEPGQLLDPNYKEASLFPHRWWSTTRILLVTPCPGVAISSLCCLTLLWRRRMSLVLLKELKCYLRNLAKHLKCSQLSCRQRIQPVDHSARHSHSNWKKTDERMEVTAGGEEKLEDAMEE